MTQINGNSCKLADISWGTNKAFVNQHALCGFELSTNAIVGKGGSNRTENQKFFVYLFRAWFCPLRSVPSKAPESPVPLLPNSADSWQD